MTLKLAIISGIIYGYANTEMFYVPMNIFWLCGLVHGLIFGIVTGDISTAMILGGQITLLTISQVASGGVEPSDICLASCITIPLALITGMDVKTALPLCIAVGLIGNMNTPFFYSVNNYMAHVVDKYVDRGDIRGIKRMTWLTAAIDFVISFPFAFIGVYFGSTVVMALVEKMPEWIVNGLNVAGGILPAIGIMVTLKVIDRPKMIPVFLMGYFMVILFGVSVIGAAIMGGCVVAIMWNVSAFRTEKQ
ncbi:PTS sugar transporter subunit IIC [Clostridium sp. AF19-22AC]|jgi:D-glucosaminate-specific PTS system IIC component|uniref:D-glucosaminate-specific PTS system IIC component n=1 Tax=Faecalicatena orotica TaxID=1544 RepID=A0A2Y9BGM0_9FIRM|nr:MULTISPECIES: PTS sugar transporter subunit IIC [Clostridia]PWJ28206.1 D-glucosaminate-specific PTS system IIC component [Faecalicatena orotica]RHR27530.1 PTS sugar transporter subunit IIC [Clostridium sp. AF19-22AC]SSA56659.1 PTS system, D-glucosaminate-specific IIC component [Faecalicatena orotica]